MKAHAMLPANWPKQSNTATHASCAKRGFVAQMVFSDSLYESSVIAEGDEQLGPYEVQDQELVILQ
jgi:hypothetical protein